MSSNACSRRRSDEHRDARRRRTTWFAAFGALLSWSFTTIAVAAKNVMTSVPAYLLLESAFTAVQWALVGPLMAFAHAKTR
jgi:hypothetical protein